MTTTHTGIEQHDSAPLFETTDALVWWWRIPTGRYRERDRGLLDSAELNRVQQMKSTQAQVEFITCRAAVRKALSGVFHVPATDISIGRNPCPGCGSAEHGPPALRHPATPWSISLAHTSGLGVLALSPFQVGIDVERIRELDVEQLDAPVLTPAERRAVRAMPEGPSRATAFLRCWTRKEAVLKAVGIGITTDLTALETRSWAPGPAHITLSALGSPTTWRVADVLAPAGWTAALALPRGAERPPSVRRL
ncbi:4'-phosphopantetheinyl transferase family protein [Streptomyces sp. NPDC059999]|uniref:4'-phosphopantetheinyl transferase family protein n=1 Tax=Streptomyces sp. NPDC059999 TaxID=3347030 RepID=UPI0036887DE2